jgi:SAM-dependent methyltransferase
MVYTISAGVGPADLKRLGNAFCHAKLLLTASELGLFTELDRGGPGTAEQIGERLDLHPRGTRDFLAALAALGLLVRDGERYANSEATSRHLLPDAPEYLGGFFPRASRVLYPAWGKLTEALRSGRPQAPGGDAGEFQRMLRDPRQLGQYLQMMDSVSGLLASALAEAFDWSAGRHLVDVGGARGNLAARLVRAHRHLTAQVFDLPMMAGPFAELIPTLVDPARVTFRGGDFFIDPLPEGDVLVLGHVLHNWSPEERLLLVRKAFAAVRPGGWLLVYDAMLDDGRADLARVLVSLNMLLVTSGGSEYPVAECRQWLAAAGFTDVRDRELGFGDTLVVGRKPPSAVVPSSSGQREAGIVALED